MRRFAISDIHGCLRTFKALLEQIDFSKEDELFLLGDLIDRGPDSKGVISLIMKYKNEGYRVRCLRGNHEALLLDALAGLTDEYFLWLNNGGEETLSSFGLSPGSALHLIPAPYVDFLMRMEWHIETEGYLLVHAGLDFRAALPLEARHALIWIRNWREQINRAWLKGRVIVHGHTPLPGLLIVKQLKKLDEVPALNIDAGCVFNGNYLNQLCAFDLDNRRLYFQRNIETKG